MRAADEDRYRDMQLDKHLNEQEKNEEISECCRESLIEDNNICSKCYEHCDVITIGEHETEQYESAMEDKADAERELRKGDDNPLKIISDYKNLAIPLDLIARKNNCSLHLVIKVLHYATVEQPQQIAECKKILNSM